MTDKPKQISNEDLAVLQNAKTNVAFMRALADKAKAEAHSSELELKNLILNLYMKYGIGPNDQIHPDGKIVTTENNDGEDK